MNVCTEYIIQPFRKQPTFLRHPNHFLDFNVNKFVSTHGPGLNTGQISVSAASRPALLHLGLSCSNGTSIRNIAEIPFCTEA